MSINSEINAFLYYIENIDNEIYKKTAEDNFKQVTLFIGKYGTLSAAIEKFASDLKNEQSALLKPWLLKKLQICASQLNTAKNKPAMKTALEHLNDAIDTVLQSTLFKEEQSAALETRLDPNLEIDEDYFSTEKDQEKVNFTEDYNYERRLAFSQNSSSTLSSSITVPKYPGTSFGNKTENLENLQKIFATDSDVAIPYFAGISHETIKGHIEKKFPAFTQLWESFKKEFQENQNLESASGILSEIQEGLKKAFIDFDNPKVIEFAAFKSDRLMVRSTGAEDTKELANAGGNESISNVIPDKTDINNAIGSVIASYFSIRSLGQRLASGDNILTPPLMPVLLQIMVGEKSENNIPVSGVMYTTEGELNTSGVVQINATFGHAEGIVTGSQPCDTYYTHRNFVHSIIGIKKRRRAPNPQGSLINKSNPNSLKHKQALTNYELKRLAAIGKKIENYYGYPMDVEWTYDSHAKKFYLLQARPIVKKSKPSAFSHLDPSKLKQLQELRHVLVIEAGQGQVCQIKPENTIFASSGLAAVEEFIKRSKDNTHPIATIVLNQPTEKTSHEAGFFRERGIAVIYSKDFSLFRDASKKETLLLDVQEGIIATVPKEVSPQTVINSGLRRHLAPHMESCSALPQNYANFLSELKTKKANLLPSVTLAKIQTSFGWNHFDRLLNAFEDSSSENERAFILDRLIHLSGKLLTNAPSDQAKSLMRKIMYNALHVWETYQNSTDEMEKKFAINWLRSALREPSATNVSNGITLYSILGEIKERNILEIKPPLSELARKKDILRRSAKFCLRPETKAQWLLFVEKLKEAEIEQMAQNFKILGPKIIEIWLNTQFLPLWNSAQANASQTLEKINLQLNSEKFQKNIEISNRTLEVCQKWSESEGSTGNKFLNFSNPLVFKELLANLQEELFKQGQVCLDALQQSKGLETFLLTNAFGKLVDTFDKCIKDLTTSTFYRDQEYLKAFNYSQLLQPYLRLACMSMQPSLLAHDSALSSQGESLGEALNKFYLNFQSLLEQNKDNKMKVQQLINLSPHFFVNYAALGSNASILRANLNSFEDLFTTLHQSMLTAIASIQTNSGISFNILPDSIKDVCQKITMLTFSKNASGVKSISPSLQSIMYEYPNIKISFNLPLNAHSAQFHLISKIDSKGQVGSMIFEGYFFVAPGALSSGRAELVGPYLLSLYESDMKKPKDFKMEPLPNTVHFQWELEESPEQWKKINEHLGNMIDYFNGVRSANISFKDFSFIKKNLPFAKPFIKGEVLQSQEKELRQNFYKNLIEGVIEDFSLENIQIFLSTQDYLFREYIFDSALQNIFIKILKNKEIKSNYDSLFELTNFICKMDPNYWKKQAYLWGTEKENANRLSDFDEITRSQIYEIYEAILDDPRIKNLTTNPDSTYNAYLRKSTIVKFLSQFYLEKYHNKVQEILNSFGSFTVEEEKNLTNLGFKLPKRQKFF